MMHSSIGTGSLAYVVGSKVMDMRTVSKDDGRRREAQVTSGRASDVNTNKLENYCDWDNSNNNNNNCTDTSYACPRESSSDSADLVSMRGSTDGAAYDSSCFIPSPKLGSEARYDTESYFDFPPLPVTDLFERSGKDEERLRSDDDAKRPSTHRKLRFEDDHVYNFQINNNVDLVMESNVSSSKDASHPSNTEIEVVHSDVRVSISQSADLDYKTEMVNRLKISDAPETPVKNATMSDGGGGAANEDRVSEWLWTLHRIGNWMHINQIFANKKQ